MCFDLYVGVFLKSLDSLQGCGVFVGVIRGLWVSGLQWVRFAASGRDEFSFNELNFLSHRTAEIGYFLVSLQFGSRIGGWGLTIEN